MSKIVSNKFMSIGNEHISEHHIYILYVKDVK